MPKKQENKLLNTIMARFQDARDSNQYNIWRQEAAEAQDFYDGIQWTPEEIEELNERGQAPTVINLIAPRIDAIIGSELENRSKSVYRDRNFSPKSRVIAEGLTQIAMQVQENADSQQEQSETFKDGLVGGIGWINIDKERRFSETPRVDPFEMVWDKDDLTAQLTDSRHVSRMRWMDIDVAKQAFPNSSGKLDELIQQENKQSSGSGNLPLAVTNDNFSFSSQEREPEKFVDNKYRKVLIVEHQYKKPATIYVYTNEEGQRKETFSKSHAEENAASKDDITTVEGDEVFRAYFTQGILLENLPLPIQTGEFTYVPFLYKRRKSDDVPYGLVRNAIDPQIEVNKRHSKQLHLLNTQGVIAEAGAVDNVERARQEISRPDFWIEVARGKNLDVQNNLQLSEGQARMLEATKNHVSQVMGVFDEFLGQQTNATSGVAVGRRQVASQRGKSGQFDYFERFKKRFGRILGKTIQTTMSEAERIQIFGADDTETLGTLVLNKPYEKNGKTYYENDLSTLSFSVVVEQVPNYEAPPELLAENLTNMIMNGQIQVLLQSPTLARAMGMPFIDKIISELQQGGGASPTVQGAPEDQTAPQPSSPPLPQ